MQHGVPRQRPLASEACGGAVVLVDVGPHCHRSSRRRVIVPAARLENDATRRLVRRGVACIVVVIVGAAATLPSRQTAARRVAVDGDTRRRVESWCIRQDPRGRWKELVHGTYVHVQKDCLLIIVRLINKIMLFVWVGVMMVLWKIIMLFLFLLYYYFIGYSKKHCCKLNRQYLVN